MGDPISCFCMAQDLLVFTGTINGRVCAWRMKEATEDSKSTELANLPGEPVTSMDTSATHLFCTFGDRFSKGWRIADVVTGDNLDGETFDFKRCQSEATRMLNCTLQSSKFCLIFTRGQGWSQLFDLERKTSKKLRIGCKLHNIPVQFVAEEKEQVKGEGGDAGDGESDFSEHVDGKVLMSSRKNRASEESFTGVEVWSLGTSSCLLESKMQSSGDARFWEGDKIAYVEGADILVAGKEGREGKEADDIRFSRLGGHTRKMRCFDVLLPDLVASLSDDLELKLWRGGQCTRSVTLCSSILEPFSYDMTRIKVVSPFTILLSSGCSLYLLSFPSI